MIDKSQNLNQVKENDQTTLYSETIQKIKLKMENNNQEIRYKNLKKSKT